MAPEGTFTAPAAGLYRFDTFVVPRRSGIVEVEFDANAVRALGVGDLRNSAGLTVAIHGPQEIAGTLVEFDQRDDGSVRIRIDTEAGDA